MPEPEFPEYAVKYSKAALESRLKLAVELRPILDKIESELAEDPGRYPERIIPASLDGTSKVYMHPNPVIQITFQVDLDRKVLYFFHFSAPQLSVEKTIFISYSHTDEPWLNKFRNFLTVLEQRGVIRFWDDTKLRPGDRWEDQIREALDSARAGLLLVSQEFLASAFITQTELPKLLEDAEKKGKKIFWLHLSPSTVFETHKEITRYQSLLSNPKTSLQELNDAEQRRALVDASRRLAEAAGSI
jgi:hypothetical protein